MNHEKKLNVTISNISTCLVLTCVTFLFPKRFTVVSFSSPLRSEKVVNLQGTRSCGVLALHSIDRTGFINDTSSWIRFAPVAHTLKKIKEIILQVLWWVTENIMEVILYCPLTPKLFFIFHKNLPTIVQNLIPIRIIDQESLITGSPFQSYLPRFLKCWQNILWRFENLLLWGTKLRKNELRPIKAFCENESKDLIDFFSRFFVTFFRFHNQRFHSEKIGKINHS